MRYSLSFAAVTVVFGALTLASTAQLNRSPFGELKSRAEARRAAVDEYIAARIAPVPLVPSDAKLVLRLPEIAIVARSGAAMVASAQ